ncbi:MAG: protein kinase, partial [Planctomycetes bacterium]|nr:protein kinase [Planctomycetota bacterium]
MREQRAVRCPYCAAHLSERDTARGTCPHCAMPLPEERSGEVQASAEAGAEGGAPPAPAAAASEEELPLPAPPPLEEAPGPADDSLLTTPAPAAEARSAEEPAVAPPMASAPAEEEPAPGAPATSTTAAPFAQTETPVTGETPLTAWSSIYATLIGRSILGCRIISLIGQGAMGAVYLAEQVSLERQVAIKTIKPELCADPGLLERFRREAKHVGKFSTPHVVQIYEVGSDQGVHAILMEYVPGGSLKDYSDTKPGRRLPVRDAVRFLTQVCDAMVEAEKLGIVHRDLKPENLLLDASGRVKVADFGISKHLETSEALTAATGFIGTPLYMSPEQCTGAELDHRSDMYSLGVTFYHLLTGVVPFGDTNPYAVLKKKLETRCFRPREAAGGEGVPEALNAVIEKMTAQKREDRYASFGELLQHLRSIHVSDVARPRAGKRGASRAGQWAAAILILAALGAAGYFIAIRPMGEPPGEPGPVAQTGPGEKPDTPPRAPQDPIDPLEQEYDALLARLRSDCSEEIRAEARALGQR